MSEKTYETSRLDATYVAPIVPKFANVKDAFLANAFKPYFRAMQAAADTHLLVLVPIPETFRIENGAPAVDYVTIDVRGTGSPMQNINPEFALLTLGSNAGLKLIDKITGTVYDVLGTTGKHIAKSILIGEASNLASKAATGKTYGQLLRESASLVVPDVISNNTPEVVKEYVSEALNPFYYGGRNNAFLQKLIYDTTGPHKAGIIPTATLLYQLNFRNPKLSTEPLLNVGWAPKQTMAVTHLAESPISQFRLFNPDQWGVYTEGQNPFGIWFSPKLEVGVPRVNSRKRLKAARARATFKTRPWEIRGDLTLNKPMVTIGEVPNRSALEYAAERAGANGIIFNNIYDNGFNLTTSIKSFVEPTITDIISRPRIMYFGPTMGKTTFTKANPTLIFDDADRIASKSVLWAKRVELSNKLGINPRDFGTNRVPKDIINSPQYKEAMDEYLATFLDSMSDYVSNPKNAGRILLTSNKNVLNPNNKVHLSNTPVIPDFNTFLTRNQRRGFRETPEEALEWWNSIISQPGVQIDNRFVSDILPQSFIREFLGTYNFGNGTKLKTRVQGFKALRFLKLIYASPLYRERVKNAYPQWSELRINNFILNLIVRADLAISKLQVSRTSNEIGNTGATTILNSSEVLEPIGLEIGYDVDDPFLIALHEGLHFGSLGGEVPPGYYQDPDALAIALHNKKLTPTLKRSYYKRYIENPDPVLAKEQYILDMSQQLPYLTREQLEELFYNRILKEGPYYNTNDELRSFGLAELLQGYYKGELLNPNNPEEVLLWLKRKYSDKHLSEKFRYILEVYRPNFRQWANYLARALSVGSIPLIQNTKENERLGSTKMD